MRISLIMYTWQKTLKEDIPLHFTITHMYMYFNINSDHSCVKHFCAALTTDVSYEGSFGQSSFNTTL